MNDRRRRLLASRKCNRERRRERARRLTAIDPLNRRALLRHQPPPEIAVGRFFAVQLHVQPSLLQIGDLKRREIESSRDGAARGVGFGDGQVEDVRSADAPDRALVDPRDRGR